MTSDAKDAPALSPITSSTRRDAAVTTIRRALLSGELAPGERVKEAAMATLLGISRPTVREAMHQLISEGSLVQEPYKGVRVARPSPRDLIDVAEVRVSLETLAALRIARGADERAFTTLRAGLRRHLDALAGDDALTASRTHLELHATLWRASGNAMLTRIWPLIEAQILAAMSLDQATRHAPARDAELHRRLVDTLVAGDEADIVAEIRQHVAQSAAEVVELIGSEADPTATVGGEPVLEPRG